MGLGQLRDRTWTEMASDRRPFLLIPVGSCEQHGPHLPLDTDTRIAEAIAERVADGTPDVVVGPSVNFGASGEHAGFAGTLSIGSAVLHDLLVELGRSADQFRAVVFVNGHGGNIDAVRSSVALLHGEGRNVSAWSPSIPDGDAHAGFTETSLLLAIDPECVRVDRLGAGTIAPLRDLLPDLRAGGVQSVSTNGILGDPREANAVAGMTLFDSLVTQLLAFLSENGEW
ncbi:actino_creatin, creatinine amidohydrolase family protein, mycofactocin system [Acidimicrobiia bacterium]